MQEHWTEKNNRSGGPDVSAGGDAGRRRQRERRLRTAMANRILACYGLRMEDWSGSKFVLRDGKGAAEIVHDLGALWPAVDKLAKQTADPLDPVLIDRMRDNAR